MRHRQAKPPEFTAVEQEVEGIIDDLELYSYYQLLDLRPDASTVMVDYNYNVKTRELKSLQKNVHCGAVMLQNLNTLVDRMDEAYQVLADAQRRHEYDVGLELGQLRHATVVEQRAIPMPQKVDRDQYLEQVTKGLEQKLGQEMLHADEEMGDEYVPIDAAYLDEAVSGLTSKLQMDALELHDPGEEEDTSADSDFAGVVLEEMEADLEQLGLDKEELGMQDDAARQEQDELRRLTAEIKQSAPQPLSPGVTPLLQSLSAPAPQQPARIRHQLTPEPPTAAPRRAEPFSGDVIDLEQEEEGLPVRAREAEQPYDDVIQLDDEDL